MAQTPRDRATKAVKDALKDGDVRRGRVTKVLFLDDQGRSVGEYASQQLPENLFQGQMQGLQVPPFSLEQLVFLAETHPTHGAAIEQKTADIVGKGWSWTSPDDSDADEEERDALDKWFRSLSPGEEDMKEILGASWLDVETVAWGMLEVARDPSGIVRRLYHVPAHTVRAHKNGFALCQVRDQRKVWFRRWGAVDVDGKPVQVDARTGSTTNIKEPANDLLILKRPSRRSTWYGIPGYVSAIGWITLGLAARDDNLMLFANRREPRWAVILKNMSSQTSEGEPLEEQIRRAFTVDLRSPHRNVIIPVEGEGDITFQKLSADLKLDGSFDNLLKQANTEVMIAHRVPADRLANSSVGPLGGNVNIAANRVYKDGVVTAGQEILNSRLNAFIAVEYPKSQGVEINPADKDDPVPWKINMQDLDVETDQDELALIESKFKADLITLREARAGMKLPPLMKPVKLDPETGANTIDPTTGEPAADGVEEVESEFNDMLYTQLPGVAKGGGDGGGAPAGDGATPTTGEADARDRALAVLGDDVKEVLRQSRDTSNRLDEALDEFTSVSRPS